MKHNLYMRFRSTLDNSPCVVLFTGIKGASKNDKTGPMLQTHIVRDDVTPGQAVKDGSDTAICGECPHRHATGGACYVVPSRGSQAAWKSYKGEKYAELDLTNPEHLAAFKGAMLRFGSYGDPAAVPFWKWQAIQDATELDGWTAYSHQWRRPEFQGFRRLCMASVDSPAEKLEANALGWRTFRVYNESSELALDEFECPASEKQGKRLTCKRCKACNGNPTGRAPRGNVAIFVHGSVKNRSQEA